MHIKAEKRKRETSEDFELKDCLLLSKRKVIDTVHLSEA
jgi:hypothetical protein